MSASIIKIIAILAMVADHVGYYLFPDILFLRVIGRLTMPIMAFFAAEGFRKTRNVHKYMIRLFLFAVISELPFCMVFEKADITSFFHFHNVIYTIFFGVVALWLGQITEKKWGKKFVILPYLLCALVSALLESDWTWIGVFMIIAFFEANKENSSLYPVNVKKSILGLVLVYAVYVLSVLVEAIQLGSFYYVSFEFINLFGLFALLPILFYNGKKGMNIKYLFYVFYPVHLLIIYFIGTFI